MIDPFSRYHHALQADKLLWNVLRLVLVALLLAAWIAWFGWADVGVYARSRSARLEADATRVEAEVDAKIVELAMEPGIRVRHGQILARLDAGPEHLALEQARARIASLEAQRTAIAREIAASERGLGTASETGSQAHAAAIALLRDARAEAKFAQREAERARALHERAQLSDTELNLALTHAERNVARVAAAQSEVARLESDRETGGLDRAAALERIGRESVSLAGQLAAEQATADRLALEVERRIVRSPIDGVVAEVSSTRAGELARSGDTLGVIVPAGGVLIVAGFAPEQAFGRVRAGQRAHFRLAGFPWAQYGMLSARVVEVAGELRDGMVRVELAIDEPLPSIPLQHGLPGDVEIEIERVSPLMLVVRAAGTALDTPAESRVDPGA
jgi:multidrug resistance efflux pump